jgi:hypothetical protein
MALDSACRHPCSLDRTNLQLGSLHSQQGTASCRRTPANRRHRTGPPLHHCEPSKRRDSLLRNSQCFANTEITKCDYAASREIGTWMLGAGHLRLPCSTSCFVRLLFLGASMLTRGSHASGKVEYKAFLSEGQLAGSYKFTTKRKGTRAHARDQIAIARLAKL